LGAGGPRPAEALEGRANGQPESEDERTLRIQARERIAAFGQYIPPKFDGALHLFRTRGMELGWKKLPENLGWGEYCAHVQTYFASGLHQSIGEDAFAEIARCVQAVDVTMESASPRR